MSDHIALPAPLQKINVKEDARVFAGRTDMLMALAIPPGGVVAEVGVMFGDFSQAIIEAMQPKKFVAFDTFTLHELPELHGMTREQRFGTKTHAQFFKDRFANAGSEIVLATGRSQEMIPIFEDKTFDFMYIDGGHNYEDVKPDSILAAKKVKPDGLMIFNDYTLYDTIANVHYGVIQAVNELVTSTDWKVAGFALNAGMFCDIALKR